ncbi:MAG TPA: tRNA glutamyl-Q(34) synthetase GluQRS [Alphaproteobacteria bacterium]|nr:tRNA glutamyl-Q(34) synthetase GluQRS [Alphaproteobacteria bacterium]
MSPAIVTRFAPSPTGYLHLGHAYSVLFAAGEAAKAGGRFLVRIEDIDRGRCRREFEDAILDDLRWLGLDWRQPCRRQSECMDDYRAALEKLQGLGLIYPCFCTRREIRAEIARAGQAPHDAFQGQPGPIGPVYPGACRRMTAAARGGRMAAGDAFALRLDMEQAERVAGPLTWTERGEGRIKATPEIFGDVVLARKDTPASYHLACTVDDHIQRVSLVTRGRDLFKATHVHRLLQELLGLDKPEYRHHRILTGANGRRLAKRDSAMTLRALREAGKSPAEVRRMAGC